MPSAPNSNQTATAAPSSIGWFYRSLYTAARFKLGSENPLKKWGASGVSKQYYGSVCATFWGLPLQQFWEKQGLYINEVAPGGAPINTFYNANKIDQSSTIVSPNTQVLYSNAFLDLSDSVLTVTYPTKTSDDLYTLIEVIDPYTNVQFSDGSAASESSTNAEQHFYWTGASDDVLINVETNFPNAIGLASPQAWVLGRVAVDPYQNPDGSGNSTTPYQQANNDPATSLNQALSRNDEFALTVAYESDGGMSVPLSTVTTEADDATTFFSQLSNAVNSNGLYTYYSGVTNGELNSTGKLYDQSKMFAAFGAGAYSIGLSAAADDGGFQGSSPAIAEGYQDAKTAIAALSTSAGANSSSNYWTIDTKLGQYIPGYRLRNPGWLTAAAVAEVGLGANVAADGTYPQSSADSNGDSLNAMEDYSLSFNQSNLPPINTPGFWSLTVYDGNNAIVANQANTYYLNPNDASAVGTTGVYALGSMQLSQLENKGLTLNLMANTPTSVSDGQTWIPTPSSGDFNVVMRLYNPVPANQEGQTSILSSSNAWIPPGIEKLVTTTNGPLRKARILLDADGDLRRSKTEERVRSNKHGQFTKPDLGADATLVLQKAVDQLTGDKYTTRLLASGDSDVISPLTTMDWGLKQLGLNDKRADRVIDRLMNLTYENITGQELSRAGRSLSRVTDHAPHQLIRSKRGEAEMLAKTHAVNNAILGEMAGALWSTVQREHPKKHQMNVYAKAITKMSKQLKREIKRSNDPVEKLCQRVIEGLGGSLSTGRINFAQEAQELDYHTFIAALAAHQHDG